MLSKIRLAFLLLLVISSITAYSQQPGAPWPKLRQNNLNTGVGVGGGSNGLQRWVFPAGQFNTLSPPVIAADGTIYLGAASNLLAIRQDGTLKWSFATGSQIYTAASIGADGTIFVGSDDFKLYAINPDGTKKWSYPTGNNVGTSPAFAADGTIYFGSSDDYLYALNPDGTLKWKFFALAYVDSSPAVDSDGTIYFGAGYGTFFAVNPDGTQKWAFDTGGISGIVSSPAIAPDGTIYFGSWDHNLYALNHNGTKKWVFPTNDLIWTAPAIAQDGTIYIGSDDKNFYAVNPDGSLKWKFTPGNKVESSAAIGSDGTIYFGSMDFNVYALKPDGTQLWSFKTGNFANFDPAIGADGTVFAASADYHLYALGIPSTTVPIASLTLSPSTVTGGNKTQATVTLTQPAPAGGDLVTLQSSSSSATVPASITIPQGSTTGQFDVSTTQVAAVSTATITATSGSSSQTATLTMNPPSLVSGLTVSPTSVIGGKSATGTVTLVAPAPASGAIVTLSSNSASAIVPQTVTVGAGNSTATFVVNTLGVGSTTTATLAAAINGSTKSANLTVQPPALASFYLDVTTVVGSASAGATVVLSGVAPAGGVVVKIGTSNSNAIVPAQVTVPEGAASVSFAIGTKVVAQTLSSTFIAILGPDSLSCKLTIQAPSLLGIGSAPDLVVGGSKTVVTGSVMLNGPAPTGGIVVTLTSANPALAKVPATVTVPAGSDTATFTITHKAVTTAQVVKLTAKAGIVTTLGNLSVVPFEVTGVTIDPATVTGGSPSAGSFDLNAIPSTSSGAIAVKLSSSATIVSVPATVSVAPGQQTGHFIITTKAVPASNCGGR